jgi:type IV pilus assembly protein PilP
VRGAVAPVLAAALVLAAGVARAQAPPPAAQAIAHPAAVAPSGAPVPAAPAAVAPSGLLVPGSGFRYDPTGRRDPFKSLLQLEKKQRDVSTLPPIQQFELETARVVGIVVDPGRVAQAMIKAPNGQTFVVRPGTIVGKNEGEVVEITMKGILVVEKYVDFMNRETRKETFLKSHPTAGK